VAECADLTIRESGNCRDDLDGLPKLHHRNGILFLEVVAHPNFGLFFGEDHVISVFVVTATLPQKSRTVRSASR
jgi:hypothetical protein